MVEDPVAGPPLDVRRIITALNDHHVDYVIVGGIAALIHGASRATKDADIVVDGSVRNLQSVARALHSLRARPRVATESVDDRNAEAAPGRRGMHVDDLEGAFVSVQTDAGPVDVLPSMVAPEGVYTYADLVPAAETFAYSSDHGLVVKVASLEHLIASKRTANRPKDLEALTELDALHRQQTSQRQQPQEPDIGIDDDGLSL